MICEKLDNFNFNNIIINDPIKIVLYNIIIFINYHIPNNIALNSIFILFELSNIIIDHDKVILLKMNNNNVFNKLIEIEEYLLSLINDIEVNYQNLKNYMIIKHLNFHKVMI